MKCGNTAPTAVQETIYSETSEKKAPWKKMRIENNENSASENKNAMQVLEIFKH